MCSGGDAGSCLEAGCPEYGIFHSPGVAERHGLPAVRHFPNFLSFITLFSRSIVALLCCFSLSQVMFFKSAFHSQ